MSCGVPGQLTAWVGGRTPRGALGTVMPWWGGGKTHGSHLMDEEWGWRRLAC